MYKDMLTAWANQNGLKYTISGKEFKTTCQNPEHIDNNPSFSINMITGACYCFSCGFKSSANRILGVKQDEDSIRLSKYLSLSRMWEEQETVDEPPASIILPPVDFYIHEDIRGVPKAILEELEVYYCSRGKYQGRLIFPIKDTRGNLLGFDARIYEHQDRPEAKPLEEFKHAKYLRPYGMKTIDTLYPLNYLWNHRDKLDLSIVVLTEGLMDALSYIALGVPAVCNFGLSSPSSQKVGYLLSLGTQQVCNGLDGDKAGIKGWQGDPENGKEGLKDAWRRWLPISRPLKEVLAVRASGYKDANDYLQSLIKT